MRRGVGPDGTPCAGRGRVGTVYAQDMATANVPAAKQAGPDSRQCLGGRLGRPAERPRWIIGRYGGRMHPRFSRGYTEEV